jgi:hypothetical protein
MVGPLKKFWNPIKIRRKNTFENCCDKCCVTVPFLPWPPDGARFTKPLEAAGRNKGSLVSAKLAVWRAAGFHTLTNCKHLLVETWNMYTYTYTENWI